MSRLEAVGVNAPQIEYWNGPAGEKWARLADTQDRMLGVLGFAAMDACDIRSGHSVLDVGCGSGTTTIELARRAGDVGRVLGIDISTPMLDVARARLASLDVAIVAFENNDVAVYGFEKEAFDRVFSRFGGMFFIDPISAFSNIRKSMASRGRLAFVCWRTAAENQWIEVPLRVVLRNVAAPPPTDPEAPGPMAFADPDRVRDILSGAGFSNIDIEAHETMIPIARDVPESVQKLLEVRPVSRLLRDVPDDALARIRHDLGDAISECRTDDGVMMGGSTWIVSATSS